MVPVECRHGNFGFCEKCEALNDVRLNQCIYEEKEDPIARLKAIKVQAGRVSVGPALVRDTAEERLFNALKVILWTPVGGTDGEFVQMARDIAKTALDEWADLRSPELNCHGDTV